MEMLKKYIDYIEKLAYYLEQHQGCKQLTHDEAVDKAIKIMEKQRSKS